MAIQIWSDLIFYILTIVMLEKSQVLSTVQQVKLRKLELEVEALWQQVKNKSSPEPKLLVQTILVQTVN